MNNKKRRATAFIIALFLLVALEIVYIFSELYSDEALKKQPTVTDSIKFKEEYEILNGTDDGHGSLNRALSISDDNPMVYSDLKGILKKMDNKESFIVYFGFPTCPWCRSVINPLIETAKELKINEIYYVNVLDVRDKYELDDDNKLVKTVEGTKEYMEILKRMDKVLDVYSPLTFVDKKGKEQVVPIKEKRIYAPNVVMVKNGNAVDLETGIIEELNDSHMEIDDGLNCKLKENFKCFLEKFNGNKVCDLKKSKC